MSTSQRRSNRPPPALKNPLAPSTFSSEGVNAAWISRPRVGEEQCGDGVLLRDLGGSTLITVIDALGHGPRAAEISEASIKYLSSSAVDENSNVTTIVEGLHGALKETRGAAALVMLIKSTFAIEICSVGNIELRSTNTKLPFLLTPGVLGVRLRNPKLCTAKSPLTNGERFLLYTDGISGRFDLRPYRTHAASDLASHIFTTHRHSHDDATVVVVDLLPNS